MSDNPSVVLKKVNEIITEDRPVPEITDDRYVKVAIKKTGICGSDIHYYTHGKIGSFVLERPMVLGHESSGIVAEVGKLVTRVKVGDRVAIEPGVPSRYSDEYKTGKYNLCPCMAFAATPPYDGTLARYYLAPEDFLVKLPDNVSLEEGALVEPLSVAVHASKLAAVKFNSKVAVFGAGPVGLLTAGCVRALGATQVLVLDIFESKLELAKKIGATHTLNSRKVKDLGSKVKEILGELPDTVIECSGAEVAIRSGIDILKSGGHFVQVGMGKDNINFPIGKVIEKELNVKGNFRYCWGDYQDAVDLIASGKINVKCIVSHRYKFKDAKAAYDNIVENGDVVKTIIDGPEDNEFEYSQKRTSRL
ncbi:Sorbitol dehydrogenase 1 [Cyberlindnera fabianii]|uniref:Sorbitol dehydrogenase 1 n=1 Tax=Cyberlindnera fabianii TaxID=36022 RepID=A0A1V2L868_CYBFA|nr:Sorbitol dehydrogenase 1 [Cyberlindnera fabianii]